MTDACLLSLIRGLAGRPGGYALSRLARAAARVDVPGRPRAALGAEPPERRGTTPPRPRPADGGRGDLRGRARPRGGVGRRPGVGPWSGEVGRRAGPVGRRPRRAPAPPAGDG